QPFFSFSVFQFFSFSVFQFFSFSVFQFFSFSVFQFFSFSVFQVFRFSGFQVFRFSGFQVFRFSGFQVFSVLRIDTILACGTDYSRTPPRVSTAIRTMPVRFAEVTICRRDGVGHEWFSGYAHYDVLIWRLSLYEKMKRRSTLPSASNPYSLRV
ncbi:hypothetical protein, partial [Pseudomonas haemolytica]|uniref:hypothetical protein n=1 Tax=Pseudomonas haemolytica TaxID=2600065 RepID=UPI00193E93FB